LYKKLTKKNIKKIKLTQVFSTNSIHDLTQN